jgi:hypothetical protein
LFYFYQILTAFYKLNDYVRGCYTSTKYWLPSTTSWRLCQRLFYLYQILTAFYKLKIMSGDTDIKRIRLFITLWPC